MRPDDEPVGFLSISAEEFAQMEGSDAEFKDSARLTPDYGGGYVGYLEVSHKLHVRRQLPRTTAAH